MNFLIIKDFMGKRKEIILNWLGEREGGSCSALVSRGTKGEKG